MTTTAARPAPGPAGAPAPPTETRDPSGEDPRARVARLALRRRLVAWSLPLVLVLLLVALKLLTMVAFGDQARDAYAGGSITGVEQSGQRLSFLNVIERHKAPFALGDARVLAGDWDGARAQFEVALALAPRDGLEACQVRVNLVLSLEKLGDATTTAQGLPAAKPYYDRIQTLVGAAPAGCFQPQGEGTGQQLDDARTRAQQKATPAPTDPGQPSDPTQPPSTGKEQQLDQQTKQNQQQRAQSQQGQDPNGGSRPQVDKPW